MADWSLYVIRAVDGSLYTGISTDPAARLERHAAGRGAKRLRGRDPLVLVASCPVGDRSAASRVEYAFKRLDKARKEDILAQGAPGLADFVATQLAGPGASSSSTCFS